ncbi:uncharacterized protein [Ambystoma mexicanum]|uniref:uncharacterized protein isoform X2 n=1 Tax=Ambystoma mexicanum TaxID=8296 RepID=UPI0037E958D4
MREAVSEKRARTSAPSRRALTSGPAPHPRRAMSRLHHEEEVSFHDASAYFSEEEWKLLQEWQKELYRNVMKEIHQALVSLGPLIVTTVCSLRAKDQDEMHPIDDPHSERKGRIHHFPSAVMADPDGPFKVTQEQPFRLHNPPYSDGSKQNDVASTEFPALNTGIVLRSEEPLPMFRKTGTAPSPDYEVVSFHIKDEEEAYCMDLQQSTSGGTGWWPIVPLHGDFTGSLDTVFEE